MMNHSFDAFQWLKRATWLTDVIFPVQWMVHRDVWYWELQRCAAWTLIDWLVFYLTSTQDRSMCANLPGGILAQAFEDSQRGSYKNVQLHAIQWIHMQRQTTGMPYLLKDKQCIQQITRTRMGKKTQAGVQHLLYQFFIITLAPLPPTSQIPYPVR